MPPAEAIRIGVIGCGHIASSQIMKWQAAGKVRVIAGVEPDGTQFARFASGLEPVPTHARSIEELVSENSQSLDAVYIATPHVLHAAQTIAALRAGLDVLLEKPMACTIADACMIERTVAETGKTLVVSFNGSLSSGIRAASDAVANGDLGELHCIAGTASENWAALYSGHWKQDPKISGGGFLLDSGSHLLNMVLDIAGCGLDTVSARFAEISPNVEVAAALSGQLQNGALVSLVACGNTVPPCLGELVFFFDRAVLRIDPWGKRPATVRRSMDLVEQEMPRGEELHLIDLFREVCMGRIANPSPASRNVEFARLWTAIRKSADHGGQLTSIKGVEDR